MRVGRGWRTVAVAVITACASVAMLVLLDGRPDGEDWAKLAAAFVSVAFGVGAGLWSWQHMGETASQDDAALHRSIKALENPTDLDEALQQACDALRAAGGHTAEIWQESNGVLVLTHSTPPVGDEAFVLPSGTQGATSGRSIVGSSWLSVWLPELLGPQGDRATVLNPLDSDDVISSVRAGEPGRRGGAGRYPNHSIYTSGASGTGNTDAHNGHDPGAMDGADAPDPETPDPETPDPETPDPATPDPETPDPATPDRVRAALLATHGELLGLAVLRRLPDDPPFNDGDDAALADLVRPMSRALYEARLSQNLARSLVTLKARNAELQRSRQRLVAASDHERRRIERDLHDGVQAQLSALVIQASVARALVERDPATGAALIEDLQLGLTDAVRQLRRFAQGIIPPALAAGGLREALHEAASWSPLSVSVQVTGERFIPDLESAVYFCCLEALANANKHAGPNANVTITVGSDGGTLWFSVSDDGDGFATDTATTGQGIANMRDRIGAFGGTFTATSGVGVGTTIQGSVPTNR